MHWLRHQLIFTIACFLCLGMFTTVEQTRNMVRILNQDKEACNHYNVATDEHRSFLDSTKQTATPYKGYKPATTEDYIVQHAADLGLNVPMASACELWHNESLTTPQVYKNLHAFRVELEDYKKRLDGFRFFAGKNRADNETSELSQIDLREHIGLTHNICNRLDLHPDGLSGIFPSQQLSFTRSGYVEPILPPLRHPEFCMDTNKLFDLNYLVHDFAAMCRKLKPTSRLIFIDMGASLSFDSGPHTPAMFIIELYRKFGFIFDHIYAYEITPTEPADVFSRVPDHLLPAYHWINVGVSADRNSSFNPLTKLLQENKIKDEDLVVVKLDIDTSSVELPLAHQLLQDNHLGEMVDQFYFEHHVVEKLMTTWWGQSSDGTVEDSLKLFTDLRRKGIAAHSWV